MTAVGERQDFQFEPFHSHKRSLYEGITTDFLPLLNQHGIPHGRAAILAPLVVHSLRFREKLSRDGIRIAGPGARPYQRKTYMFARFLERICEYLKTKDSHLIPILERELFFLTRNLTGHSNYRIFTYWGRRIILLLVQKLNLVTRLDDHVSGWLLTAVAIVRQRLQTEQLIELEHGDLLSQSTQDMVKEIEKKDSQLRVVDMALFASYAENLKLLTFQAQREGV